MKIRYFLLVAILVIAFGCTKRLPPEEKNSLTPSKAISITVDMAEQHKLQDEVDKGHQPWRLDPVMVSESYCGVYKDDKIFFSCKEANPTKRETTVICDNESEKRIIHLKRLVRDDGIWTITKVEIIEKN